MSIKIRDKYAIPTVVLLMRFEHCVNPVTKSVLREIIIKRLYVR